jgi:anti-sigma-K factor RskA
MPGAAHREPPRPPERAMPPRATPPARGSRVLALGGWIAAAASIAAAAYLGSMVVHQRQDLENFARIGTQLRQRVVTRDSLLALRDSMIAQLLSPDVQTVTLASTGQLPSARLYVNRTARRVILSAYSLPSAPAGRTYQLWGLRDGGAPVSLGTFNTGPDARVVSEMDLPPGVTIVASAVTEEPAGGSAAPTSTPFLIAQWKRG